MPEFRPDHAVPAETVAALVLYVRHGCHLCDQFLVDLSLELGPAIERLQLVDVDSDADLAMRYGLRVPVLALGDEPICEAVLDPCRLRDVLGL